MLEGLADGLMEPPRVLEFPEAVVIWNEALGGALRLVRVEVCGISGIGAVGNYVFQVGY